MAYKAGRFKGKTASEARQINLDKLKKVLPPNVVKKIFGNKKAMGGYMKRNDGGIAKNTRMF
jgi:hypothetical protein